MFVVMFLTETQNPNTTSILLEPNPVCYVRVCYERLDNGSTNVLASNSIEDTHIVHPAQIDNGLQSCEHVDQVVHLSPDDVQRDFRPELANTSIRHVALFA